MVVVVLWAVMAACEATCGGHGPFDIGNASPTTTRDSLHSCSKDGEHQTYQEKALRTIGVVRHIRHSKVVKDGRETSAAKTTAPQQARKNIVHRARSSSAAPQLTASCQDILSDTPAQGNASRHRQEVEQLRG
jgi:hypothetical protein